MSGHNAYRDGKIHVCQRLCDTCVFRPGNLMHLEAGRLAAMVTEARANESAIICHPTLYADGVDNAVCRGFYDRYPTQPLQIADRLGLIEFDPVPTADAESDAACAQAVPKPVSHQGQVPDRQEPPTTRVEGPSGRKDVFTLPGR